MIGSRATKHSWRTFIARHLFAYLAILAGVVVVVSAVVAREELAGAISRFDRRLIPVVLGLSSFNYGLRFLKWHRLLKDSGIRVPLLGNARLYFACLAMVVTPARIGELYKLVFLRRLYGIAPERSLPPLVVERGTDALAVLALIAVQPFDGAMAVLAVLTALLSLLGVGWLLAHPRWRGVVLGACHRLPWLSSRIAGVDRVIEGHARLLHPKSMGPNLALSTISWWAECVGLAIIVRGVSDASVGLVDSTWIYALSTLLGNLTFLPGGLGGTEVSLVALLRTTGMQEAAAIGATALIRGATLWFAVAVGLAVTLRFRHQLRWSEVSEEAAGGGEG